MLQKKKKKKRDRMMRKIQYRNGMSLFFVCLSPRGKHLCILYAMGYKNG